MGSSSKHHDSGSSSKKHSSSSRSKTKSDDWSDVTEPDERRRIQNRIAQRKFREKTKEQKEKADRDARNQEHAASSYHIPDSAEIEDEEEVSGLPWGGISMRHVVARGHESESRRGNSGDDNLHDGNRYYGQYGSVGGGSGSDVQQSRSYSYGSRDNSSGGGDFLDESTFYYPDYDGAGGDGSHQ